MTQRIYEQDPDCLAFTATVLACEEKDGGYDVILDRTAFFPEGGGQGADHGTLGGAAVTDAHDAGGEVRHRTDQPLCVGATVEGRVDGARGTSL